MTPPLLSRNTPVFEVAHPCKVNVFSLFWIKCNVAAFNGLDCRFSEWSNLNKPLVAEQGLNDHA